MPLSLDITTSLNGAYSGINDLGTPNMPLAVSSLLQLSTGTGSGQADLLFSDTRTLAASATENLDLAGTLTDPFGAVLSFVKIKAIYIKAAAANTNSVVIGATAANAFLGPLGGTLPTVTLAPGGVLLLTHPGAGWTVTAATGDLLKITNSGAGTGVNYDVILVGTSA